MSTNDVTTGNVPGHAPEGSAPELFHSTRLGQMYLGDSVQLLNSSVVPRGSVDLIVTSPPFGLVRKKEYGNADAGDYLKWFQPFARAFKRVLKPNGSLVIDIGGAWIPGQPTRSLYHFKLLIMLCERYKFHLCQEFYWWNPSKLPTPAEWVNVRRIRVKDAVNCIWWLSPSPWPRASNRRVKQPYSPAMHDLLKHGYQAKLRPSGHDISAKFSIDNGAAIPPNLIALPNTESNSYYLRYCKEHNLKQHPARFPAGLPEYFIRMLTDPGDLVVDPLGGSCVTGEVAERLERRWVCVDLSKEYLTGALGRFVRQDDAFAEKRHKTVKQQALAGIDQVVPEQDYSPKITDGDYYKLPRPGIFWNGPTDPPLPADGGRTRPTPATVMTSATRVGEAAPRDDSREQ